MEADREKKEKGLTHFLDTHGRLKTWPPAKERDKILILAHLASPFVSGRTYPVKEVDEQLKQHIAFADYGIVRRALIEYSFMDREHDGSFYWLTSLPLSDEERIILRRKGRG